MIIDAHTHIWDKDWRPRWNEEGICRAISHSKGVSLEDAQKTLDNSWDPSGDKLVAEMDKNGVDVAIILRIDYGMVVTGEDSKVPIEDQSRITAQIVQKYPGRLLWGMSVDPRRPNAIKIVDLCLGELGAKRIKFYPPAGYYPNDRIVYPIYEKAVKYGVPVDFHTEPVSQNLLRSKYCYPLHLDDVAADFPDLKIMVTHAGGPFWWQEVLAVAQHRQNIYLNVANWQPERRRNLVECYRKIREMMNRVGSKRIMWASDWVGPGIMPQRNWLKAFQEIPIQVKNAGIEFSEKELKDFLGDTAAEFQGIPLK